MTQSDLASAIEARDVSVSVLGVGYVGLPLCIAFADEGIDVVGYDINENRIDKLRSGESYVDDVTDEAVADALERGFHPTTDPDQIQNNPVHIFAVPTDFRDGKPKMGPLQEAVQTVATRRRERDETLFVVTSTVYPGAIESLVEQPLQEYGFSVGEDAFVAIAPERINPGDGKGVKDLPINVGANDRYAREATATLFRHVAPKVFSFDSLRTVETAKIIENGYRLVNISFINDVAKFADEFDVDVWDAIEAASTKPMGFQPFYPGPGAGGHCIPVDPRFLLWQADNINVDLPVLQSAIETNESMPAFVADRIKDTLIDAGTDVDDATIIAMGLTYKPDVGDVRHSPAREICNRLIQDGANVLAVDPLADDPNLDGGDFVDKLRPEMMDNADLIAVLVDHSSFDLDRVARDASLVFDARDAVPDNQSGTVVRLSGDDLIESLAIQNLVD